MFSKTHRKVLIASIGLLLASSNLGYAAEPFLKEEGDAELYVATGQTWVEVNLRDYFGMEQEVVRFDTKLGSLDENEESFYVEMLRDYPYGTQDIDTEAEGYINSPSTVANFLDYADYYSAYDNTFFHRYIPGRILQGGGYYAEIPPSSVPKGGAILNEFNGTNANVRGTLAMARLSNDEDSAVTQWFFNLTDNSADLDFKEGGDGVEDRPGYTVFGRVMGNGMEVLDGIVDSVKVWNLQDNDSTSPFSDVPLLSNFEKGKVTEENMIIVSGVSKLVRFPGDYGDEGDAILRFENSILGDGDQVTLYIPGEDEKDPWDSSYLKLNINNSEVKTTEVKVTATDIVGHTVEKTFNVNVANISPTIESGPVENIAARVGDTVTLSVEASSDARIEYQWYKKNGDTVVALELLCETKEVDGVETVECEGTTGDTAVLSYIVTESDGTNFDLYCEVKTGDGLPQGYDKYKVVTVDVVKDYARLTKMESTGYVGNDSETYMYAGVSLETDGVIEGIEKKLLVHAKPFLENSLEPYLEDGFLEAYYDETVSWGEGARNSDFNFSWDSNPDMTEISTIAGRYNETLDSGSGDPAILREMDYYQLHAVLSPENLKVAGGMGTLQVFDGDETGSEKAHISNLSTRALIRSKSSGEDAMLKMEFTVEGETDSETVRGEKINVLIRGVGRSIESEYDVLTDNNPVMENPLIVLYDSDGADIGSNDSWIESDEEGHPGYRSDIERISSRVGAFDLYTEDVEVLDELTGDPVLDEATGEALTMEVSDDAALFVSLKPGTYTVELTDASEAGEGGIGMIEIYEVR